MLCCKGLSALIAEERSRVGGIYGLRTGGFVSSAVHTQLQLEETCGCWGFALWELNQWLQE